MGRRYRRFVPYFKLFKREKSVSSSSSSELVEYRDRCLYKYFVEIQTRWRDNDVYGHVNNAVYLEWIDSIVNKYLIEKCNLDPLKSPLIGFVVYSYCSYYSPISYPSTITAGLSVKRIGNSSVDYLVGIFDKEESLKASAVGGFTHVFVDRKTGRPQSINQQMKKELLSISNFIN